MPLVRDAKPNTLGRAASAKGDDGVTSYEYKFVRLGEQRSSAIFGPGSDARKGYETAVHEHARDG